MSVMPLRFLAKYTPFFSLAVLSVAFCTSSARAQAPAVVIDAQQSIGNGFNNPQNIAVSTNGTVYVADTANNRIVALTPNPPLAGTYTVVSTYPYILVGPEALALDANGDLFIGDTPTAGPPTQGRIIKLAGDGKGNPVGAATQLYSGPVLGGPIALAVDSAGDLFIGDYPSTEVGAIYKLAAGAPGTPVSAGITGLSSQLTPAGLLAIGTNLYIADNGNSAGTTLGGVYIAPVAGGAATTVATPGFKPVAPSGFAVDTAGDLYILTGLYKDLYFTGQQILVIPASSPDTPYLFPNTALGTGTGMAFDPSGNLDVLALYEKNAGQVIQFAYVSPVNLGSIAINQDGTQISYNFGFNAPFTFNGFKFLTQGDNSTEVVQATGGTCTTGKHTTLPNHGPTISATNPYVCQNAFYGVPNFPGKRTSSIELKGAAGAILDSTQVFETGLGGAEITYPLNATATAVNLQQPQAVVVSGLNNKVYVADFEAGVVYATNGVAGATLTPISTKPITLSGPAALALDGSGNLYIGDFNLGEVIKVPTSGTPSVVNAGGLLQHPIAITFDQQGNLYIGDAGSGGIFADFANPGYVVKVPVGGTPAKLATPSVAVVFPQALAADPINPVLWIGDGGDPSSVGQVVQVALNGSSASAFPIAGVTNPTGLGFDTAQSLYVLDGTANTITVVPPASTEVAPHLVEFNNSLLAQASAMGMSAGGQSFIIANIGAGSSNSLVYIDGNRSTLAFGGVEHGTSAVLTATEYNIGDSPITLGTPFYTTNVANKAFTVLPSSTCSDGVVLKAAQSCTLNVQFAPTALGQTSQDITVQSNAYNPGAPSGAPILRVVGTGK
jgi:sugar lactone lactonase YvrE